MAELVGRDGPETRTFDEPGTVIPNDKLALYQQMMEFIRSANQKMDPINLMPQAGPVTGSTLRDLVGSLPLASMGTGARVQLAPRPGAGTNLRAPVVGGQGMQFVRQPFTQHPARGAYPAVAAGQVAANAQPYSTLPEGVAGGPEPSPAEQWPVPTQPPVEPEMGAYRPVGAGGEGGKRPTPEGGQSAKKAPKRAAVRREPTLLEKITATLAGSPGSNAPKRNATPGGHYQFGGRPPIGQRSQVGEDGPEAFVADREFGNDFSAPQQAASPSFPTGPMSGSTPSLQSLFGNGGGGFAQLFSSLGSNGGANSGGFGNFLASLFGGRSPFMGGMKRFEEGGRPDPGEPAVVGEAGPEAFVPDTQLPEWLTAAASTPTNPAPQPRMYKGREVADYSKRDPDAEVAQSKERWAHIRDNPADVMENLGLTGGIIGAAMKNASPISSAHAQPAGGKKEAKPTTPMNHIQKEQQELIKEGFLPPTYKDRDGKDRASDDGAEGPATIEARKKRVEHLLNQQKQNDQALEREKLRAQEGANIARTEEAKANALLAKAQADKIEADRLAGEQKTKDREQGAAALKKAEESTGPITKFLREWGPMLGYGVGGALGVGSRLKVLKSANKTSKEVAEAAEAPFASNLANTSDRVARVNRFWREGGAGEAVPFSSNMSTKAGFSANAKPADLSTLYPAPTRSYQKKDIGIPVAALGESGISSAVAWDAQNRLDAAVAAYNADPTQANIDAIQSAKNYLASAEFMANLGRGGAAGYVGTAAKTSRKPTRPNTSPAEAEKMELEKLLPRQRVPKQEVLPPPKQIQAGVPPALGPEAWMARQVAPPAPVQALPPPSMVAPSLVEMTAPPVRPARVPRKPKKAASP